MPQSLTVGSGEVFREEGTAERSHQWLKVSIVQWNRVESTYGDLFSASHAASFLERSMLYPTGLLRTGKDES